MSPSRFEGDPIATDLINSLYANVGAFFSNTRRGAPLTCVVCTGPAGGANEPPLCGQCRAARDLHAGSLADLIVPLAYAKGHMPSLHQSAHTCVPTRRRRPHSDVRRICS
jgi:hypothetical protein